MIFNNPSVAYSLLLSIATIAFTQASAIAQPPLSQPPATRSFNPAHEQRTLSPVTILAGKPGLPRRRVGGGSRLY